ncbi:hypothetical protein ACIQU4_38980 [Streptomyces sp. NPDC090741]|uniref:hypothetical protein n=1 Tax=Streptomyces sp. NPDC090741 TaxID=3365967 RepID=UPI003820087E
METNRQKIAALMAGVALVGLVGATPAQAEGSRETYITQWAPGKESGRWTDNNNDSAWTGVYFQGCSTDSSLGYNRTGLQLWKNQDFRPDINKGYRVNYCGWVDWNDPDDAGTYYFRLDSLLNGGYLWVDYVKIGW